VASNPVCYWELASHDAGKTVAFLNELFGWRFAYDPATTIHERAPQAPDDDGIGGGVFTLRTARLPFLTVYVRVDDIDDMAQRVERLGGLVVVPVTELAGGARICLFNEPCGVTLAMIQPAAGA
jgi:predicted enzyme related to lactoylglutathione lyase